MPLGIAAAAVLHERGHTGSIMQVNSNRARESIWYVACMCLANGRTPFARSTHALSCLHTCVTSAHEQACFRHSICNIFLRRSLLQIVIVTVIAYIHRRHRARQRLRRHSRPPLHRFPIPPCTVSWCSKAYWQQPAARNALAQALILIPNLKYFESRNFDQKP